jgi:2-keto-4-pentenoate hydratase/2-oxohepta-3-ene-1,7-dioic acid hydratase in catechol pathway
MKLVTIDCVPGGRPGAILASGDVLHLERAASPGTAEAWLPTSLRGILAAGREGLDLVRRIVARVDGERESGRERLRRAGALLPATTRLLAPIPEPTLFVSCGQAYRSHVAEMKGEAPPHEPHAFLKAAATVIGPGTEVALPPQCSDMVDYEGELCAVIGRVCHNVSAEEAMDYVAGYTITNDLSARNWVPGLAQAKTTAQARLAWDLNHMGKQLPGFSPLGPALVTADEVGDVATLTLTTRLNGAVMQQAATGDLIHSVASSIAYFSRWYMFQPGDILSTGTPAGVGYGRDPKVFLKPGDLVEIEVSRVGTLATRIVAAAY